MFLGYRTLRLIAILITLHAWIAFAHEGHHALPTKGVQVDVKSGHLILSAQAREVLGLKAEQIVVGDVVSSLATYAETVAPWHAHAFGSAQIAGRITRLHAKPGDIVSKGQVVAEISSRELDSLRLTYLQAKNDVALNRKLLEATGPAAREGAVPQQRLDEIENALAQSQNDLEIAKIRASTLGLDAKEFEADKDADIRHLIRSPISGKIVHSDLTEGKFVEEFEHLFEIVNLDEVWSRSNCSRKISSAWRSDSQLNSPCSIRIKRLKPRSIESTPYSILKNKYAGLGPPSPI